MGNRQLKQTMNGAVILTIAAFIAKVLSAVYRVPFQNMVGNTGFYVYQQVYPLYGLGMTLALNGLPVFLSKLIAETPTPGRQQKVQQKLFVLLSGFSLAIFLGLYFGANAIANGMGDRQLSGIIQAVSWQFLLVPFLSVSRGYFQGTFQMIPTAVSQVVEQLVRVAVILLVAYTYNETAESVYQMGADAMSSAWIAAIAASITMGIFLLSHRKKQPFSAEIHLEDHTPTYQTLLKRLGTEGLVLCLLSAMLLLLQLIDSFTLFNGLVQADVAPAAARNLKGIYDRGQPLVQLGMVVATAFASSLLPALTDNVVKQKPTDFLYSAKSLLRITIAIASAATFGMIVLNPYMNHTLFGDKQGNLTISIYLLAILLASVIGAVNAIFQSRNQHRVAFTALVIGLAAKAVLNTPLVVLFGTPGSSIGTVLALSATTLFSWRKLDPLLKAAVFAKGFRWKLSASCLMMMLTAWLATLVMHLFGIDNSRVGSFLTALVGVGVGAGVFIRTIISLKLLTLREWLILPFGKRVLRK